MAFNDRGVAYGLKGEADHANADFDQAVALNAQYAPTFNNRAIAYAAKSQLDRAIQDYDQAVKLNTGYAIAFYNRGTAKYDKGANTRRRPPTMTTRSSSIRPTRSP